MRLKEAFGLLLSKGCKLKRRDWAATLDQLEQEILVNPFGNEFAFPAIRESENPILPETLIERIEQSSGVKLR